MFQKMPKNGFFDLFFHKFACGAENLAKKGTFQCFRRAQKIFGRPKNKNKKGRQNFRKIFENPPPPPPPLEKILDPPLNCILLIENKNNYKIT